ncbi:MAG: GIY-YIG nuclease family protein [Megamonas funiformis]|jgi:hypothetical protein|uniref:GIY-YIG nuclease family protein n=1 Tax=Megamonas funiformis TaxID=437897 RepID=UPI001ED767A4|nr:GIY-YIG nuclease family protein [Megamonas funiformis]MBS7213101.1 GIY-YIG nuclease family protein [Megamonas funiformis]
MNDKKSIYVLYDELGRIKLGITNNVTRRIKQIENSTGLKICKLYSEVCRNATFLEKKLFEYFKNYRIEETEWLVSGMDFYKTVSVVRSFIEDDKP